MTLQKLSVAADKRHLVQADGRPFFYLGDTGWRMIHALSREEVLLYLDKRAVQGFNVIQVMMLDEFDGVRAPNFYGRCPFKRGADGEYDPTLPDTDGEYSFWAHADFCIDEAAKRGVYIALLPTWGDKFNLLGGYGPEFFYKENAYVYGKWIGERYRGRENIIWVLGGDRPMTKARHFEVVRAMAEGIRSVDRDHLCTFHPRGGQSSSESVGDEAWLDINMIQSGHARRRYNYEMIQKDYALDPPKPVLDGEPGYEHHPDEFNPANGYLDEVDCRQEFFWSVFSGACGHTYGDHSVWGMWTPPVRDMKFISRRAHFCVDWKQALDGPGAWAMHVGRDIVLSRDFLSSRPAPALIADQLPGVNFAPALLGRDYCMVYIAQGVPVSFAEGALPFGKCLAQWISPRDGATVPLGELDDAAGRSFTPPTGGRGQDWVLLLDAKRG